MSTAIAARGLGKRFGATQAIRELTLEVPRGSAFALLGPNGAGKTTSVRLFTALLDPSEGEAEVVGHRLGRDNDAIRRSTGLLTEVPGLYPRLTAMENLLFFAALHDLSPGKARPRIEAWLKRFDLWDRRDHQTGAFSTGMRQKVALARALLHEPELVFLDEPTSGLDPESTRTVREVIKEQIAAGRTVVLCTHHLDEAERLCDHVAFIRGRVLAVEPIEGQKSATVVTLAGDAARFVDVVRTVSGVTAVQTEGAELRLTAPPEINPAVVRALCEAGAEIRYVAPARGGLEARYFRLIAPEAQS